LAGAALLGLADGVLDVLVSLGVGKASEVCGALELLASLVLAGGAGSDAMVCVESLGSVVTAAVWVGPPQADRTNRAPMVATAAVADLGVNFMACLRRAMGWDGLGKADKTFINDTLA
jgi:hypothetical protein